MGGSENFRCRCKPNRTIGRFPSSVETRQPRICLGCLWTQGFSTAPWLNVMTLLADLILSRRDRLLRARGWIVEEAHKLCQEILDYRLEHKLDTVFPAEHAGAVSPQCLVLVVTPPVHSGTACGLSLDYRATGKIVERVVGNQPLQNWEDPNWRPQILNEAAKRVAPMMPCGRHGFTATGQVIEIWRINQLRPNDILEKCSREDISLWWHFHLESGMLSTLEGAAKFQNPLRGQILVFDMHGFGVRHLHKSCISLLISLFGIGQSKYPESLNRVFVLNAPTLFSGLWNTVKGVLNERTRNKIVMTSKGMHDDLKALVPPERMPVFLGGDCPCNIGEEISASGAGFTTVRSPNRGAVCTRIEWQEPEGSAREWLPEVTLKRGTGHGGGAERIVCAHRRAAGRNSLVGVQDGRERHQIWRRALCARLVQARGLVRCCARHH